VKKGLHFGLCGDKIIQSSKKLYAARLAHGRTGCGVGRLCRR